MKKVLIIVAHPDDEILGCGATVARLIKEGNEAYTIILGEGVTSRSDYDIKELETLKQQCIKANNTIGIKSDTVFIYDFPDNKFDTVPLLDIVKKISKIKEEIKPNIIFTHFRNDLNIDHRITYQAVNTACRPMDNETVKIIYSFEVLSSTEWNFPLTFSPNVFFDISKTIDKKIKAMKYYQTELRIFPHPRSIETIKSNAKTWGSKVGMRFAEAFELVISRL